MNIPGNIKQYEKFTENLKITLEKQTLKRDENTKELEKYANLKKYLTFLKEKNLKEIKMKFDAGCSVFYDAEIDLTQKIIMNLGLDVYTEMTINEALEHIEKKIGIFTRKNEFLSHQIAKTKSYTQISVNLVDEIIKSSNTN